jgi:hypothetical protein
LSKIDEYEARAAESRAARDAATNERDRVHHNRAYDIWRRLIVGVGQAEERAAIGPVREVFPAKAARASPSWREGGRR